jgi:hypothetical protein
MINDERKEAAQWLIDFYSAVARGKTVQVKGANGGWIDCHTVDYWPGMGSALNSKHEWRIKPEPRRKWETSSEETYNLLVASEWKVKGFIVTEWMEVV